MANETDYASTMVKKIVWLTSDYSAIVNHYKSVPQKKLKGYWASLNQSVQKVYLKDKLLKINVLLYEFEELKKNTGDEERMLLLVKKLLFESRKLTIEKILKTTILKHQLNITSENIESVANNDNLTDTLSGIKLFLNNTENSYTTQDSYINIVKDKIFAENNFIEYNDLVSSFVECILGGCEIDFIDGLFFDSLNNDFVTFYGLSYTAKGDGFKKDNIIFDVYGATQVPKKMNSNALVCDKPCKNIINIYIEPFIELYNVLNDASCKKKQGDKITKIFSNFLKSGNFKIGLENIREAKIETQWRLFIKPLGLYDKNLYGTLFAYYNNMALKVTRYEKLQKLRAKLVETYVKIFKDIFKKYLEKDSVITVQYLEGHRFFDEVIK